MLALFYIALTFAFMVILIFMVDRAEEMQRQIEANNEYIETLEKAVKRYQEIIEETKQSMMLRVVGDKL